jgi:hypothetical protein
MASDGLLGCFAQVKVTLFVSALSCVLVARRPGLTRRHGPPRERRAPASLRARRPPRAARPANGAQGREPRRAVLHSPGLEPVRPSRQPGREVQMSHERV